MFSPFPTSPKTNTNLKQHNKYRYVTFTKPNAKSNAWNAWSNAFHDASKLHDSSPDAQSSKHDQPNAPTNEPPHDDESPHDVDDAANAPEHGRVPETNDANFPTHVEPNAPNAVTIVTYSTTTIAHLKSDTHQT